MTRINLIHETTLSPKHLSGEFHEITRVYSLVRKNVEAGRSVSDIKIPERFKLERGHVKFFYNKLDWITRRYVKLALELKYRNPHSKVDFDQVFKTIDDARRDIPTEWWNDWSPNPEDVAISYERILERL